MARKLAFVVMAIVAAASPVSALEVPDNMLGTMSVRSEPRRSNGALTGCQIVFDSIQRDWIYRKGKHIRVDGSILLSIDESAMGVALKVVVNEIEMKGFQVSFTPSPPSRAYIVAKDLSTNFPSLLSASKSDTPGGIFAIYPAEPTIGMVVDAVTDGTLMVAFNSFEGRTDIQTDIDLLVVETDKTGAKIRNRSAVDGFMECVLALTSTYIEQGK